MQQQSQQLSKQHFAFMKDLKSSQQLLVPNFWQSLCSA